MIQIDTNEEKERETGVDSEDMVALGINFGRAHALRNLLLTGKLSKKGLRWLPVRGKCYSYSFALMPTLCPPTSFLLLFCAGQGRRVDFILSTTYFPSTKHRSKQNHTVPDPSGTLFFFGTGGNDFVYVPFSVHGCV